MLELKLNWGEDTPTVARSGGGGHGRAKRATDGAGKKTETETDRDGDRELTRDTGRRESRACRDRKGQSVLGLATQRTKGKVGLRSACLSPPQKSVVLFLVELTLSSIEQFAS